jgi:hypothetical protein
MADDTPHFNAPPTPAPVIKTEEPAKPSIFSSTPATKPVTDTKPNPDTAAAKLRAFEDKYLGKKAVRSKDGHVEKGYGSPFKAMTPEQHAEHAALEKLVEAEAKVDEANIELSTAKAALESAKAAVVEAKKVSDAAAIEAKKAADEEAREAKADAAAPAA